MPHRILAFPFMVGFIFLLYRAFIGNPANTWFLIALGVVSVAIVVMGPQIDWIWYKRHPPKLDEKIQQLLMNHHSFYQKLDLEQRKKFRDRMALFILAKDFEPQGPSLVPEDIKAAVASAAVQLTFGMHEYLFPKFEKIIIYAKPFPSPQYPTRFHASEIYTEDGVLLFSAEQLMQGFVHSQSYFNLAMYEFARVMQFQHPHWPFPELGEADWPKLEAIGGFSKDWITQWINLSDPNITAAFITHYFTFPEKFQEKLPDLYGQIFRLLGVDPKV